MIETILLMVGMIAGSLLVWFFVVLDLNSSIEYFSSRNDKLRKLKDECDEEMYRAGEKITKEQLKTQFLEDKVKLSIERELKTAKALKSAIKSGYQAKASDAKMRAFRNKAPKKLLSQMENWLDGAIKQGLFDDWQNKPTTMKTEKPCK